MAELPESPIPASEFLESFLPRAFAEAELPEAVKRATVKLGVRLDGEGGGEWALQIEGGVLQVSPGSRAQAALTLVQSVEHWRGALWEGRGGALGRRALAAILPGGAAAVRLADGGPSLGAGALSRLGELDGLLRLVVAGDARGDWQVDLKLGPGEIPDQPSATVTLAAEDAASPERGELDPVQAFMTGRVRVEGDISLLMQVQAARSRGAADE